MLSESDLRDIIAELSKSGVGTVSSFRDFEAKKMSIHFDCVIELENKTADVVAPAMPSTETVG